MSEQVIHNSDFVAISYADIRKAMGGKPYHMSLSESASKWVIEAVNRGIDSHLEACYSPDLGDSYAVSPRMVGEVSLGNSLNCEISPESLPTLLRRLEELGYETEWDDLSESPICLVDAILETLGFNYRGEFVGQKEE